MPDFVLDDLRALAAYEGSDSTANLGADIARAGLTRIKALEDEAGRQMAGLMASWEREAELKAEVERLQLEVASVRNSLAVTERGVDYLKGQLEATTSLLDRAMTLIPDPDDLRTVLSTLEALTSGDRLPAGWSDALDRVRATLPKG